jgi:hypothetical protein
MEIAAEREKLESKIVFYRCGWWLFMVLMVGPAWYLASTVEGVPFSKAVDIIRYGLHGLHFPDFLVSLVSYPVTMLATLIPGSSALVFLILALFISYGAFFFAFMYFALVQPPNFYEMKSKLDPDWQAKEDEGVIVKPLARPVMFSGFIVFLLLTSLAGEIFYGYNRSAIADDYTGTLFLLDGNNKKTPINVNIKLAVIDPGRIYDRKPGVSSRSFHIELDSKDPKALAALKALGIDEKLFAENAKNLPYDNGVCSFTRGTVETGARGYTPGTWLVRSYHIKNKPASYDPVKCPTSMHFGVVDFDRAQFAIADIAKSFIIVADLERHSRISFIQRMIMKHRYDKNPRAFYEKD